MTICDDEDASITDFACEGLSVLRVINDDLSDSS